MITAPQLFAKITPTGNEICLFCGGQCEQKFITNQYIAESFTERDCVAAPGSDFVCGGCVATMRSDLGSIPLIDGTIYRSKEGGKRKPREGAEGSIQVRWFSWIITKDKALAATPGHRELLRSVCLSPPMPPFAICIADGNKHQLFRTPVNFSTGMILLNCEGTRVSYQPDELTNRLKLTTRLVSVVGKGSSSLTRLYDPNCNMGVVLQLAKEFNDAQSLYEEWINVRNEPLSELAFWLTPGKDDAIERLAAASFGEV